MSFLGTVVWHAVGLFNRKNVATSGAAVAFYVVTSLPPVLVIVIAIAGAAFGDEAARGAIVREFSGILGSDASHLLQTAILSASKASEGITASIASLAALLIAASGVFVELRAALNALWDAPVRGESLTRFLHARATSVGLVFAIGFLLAVSLMLDAGIQYASGLMADFVPFSALLLRAVGFALSFLLIDVLFAVLYGMLPSRSFRWRLLLAGATTTTILFQFGKLLLAIYLSHSVSSTLGAGGALIALLLWVYYSTMIFLFGAALMRSYCDATSARRHNRQSALADPALDHAR